MAYFGRQVWLELGASGSSGRRLVDLRIAFRCHLDRSGTPNTAEIEVYNPAPGTIGLVDDHSTIVRLVAGYDAPRAIFTGNPTRHGVSVQKQGPDRVLKLELQDGGDRLAEARVDVAYLTETTLSQVVETVSAQLGLPRGVIRLERDVRLPHGVTLRGPARAVLDRIAVMASASPAQWFVRDGALYLLRDDGSTGEPAIEVSTTRGNLIGSPAPKDKGIEVVALLDPGIRPGRAVVVDSARVRGTYVVQAVDYVGDSGFDRSFYAQFTAREKAA